MDNRISIVILAMLAALHSQELSACQEPNWSPAEYTRYSKMTYVGVIQSKEPIGLTKEQAAKASYRSLNYLATLAVAETLVGDEVNQVGFEMHWCHGGIGEVGERVVAFKVGNTWHVKNSTEAIMEAQAAVIKTAKDPAQ